MRSGCWRRCKPCFGRRLHVGDVDAICRFDHPLTELEEKPVSAVDKQIASYIVPRIPDGCTMQIGLGGISNAVAYSLIHHKHIGIHTEMLTDSKAPVTGVAEAGLYTTVLPAARAGPILWQARLMGKLNGVIAQMTPKGWRIV